MRLSCCAKRSLIVLGLSFLALLIGFITGLTYGGNYAADMEFFTSRGYEASGKLAALVSGSVMLLLAASAYTLLRTRKARITFTLSTLLGLTIIPPTLFATIDGRSELLPLLYIGAGLAGAAVGYALGRILPGNPRRPGSCAR